MTHLLTQPVDVTGFMEPTWLLSFSRLAIGSDRPQHLGTACVAASSQEAAYDACLQLGIVPFDDDDPDDLQEVMIVGPVERENVPSGQPFDILLSRDDMMNLDLDPINVTVTPDAITVNEGEDLAW